MASALAHRDRSAGSWLRPSAWGALLCAALALPVSARADAYTWTDADGTVHFSETPPPQAKSKKIQPAEPAREAAASAVPERRIEKLWVAATPSRSLMLEKVVPLLIAADRGFVVGARCDGGEYSVADAMRWTQSADLQAFFNVTLLAYGFATPGEAAARAFANEAPKPPDLNVIAEIVGVSASCGGIQKLEVRWRFWDNLRRKQVFDIVTRGADVDEARAARSSSTSSSTSSARKSRGGGNRDGQMKSALGGAFIESLEELLRKPQLIQLVTPSASVAGSEIASEPGGKLEPIVLAFRHGPGTGSFRAQVAALKQAAPTVRTTSGHGSGLLLAPSYVLTNRHVVGSEHEVLVVMGEREIPARVLRSDEKRDIALLKLEADVAVRPYLVGRTPLVDGDTLYVIGTPLDEGLSESVTRGVLSGTREHDGQSYYQTDAAVNPGNSGGPVLDDRGELVGLVVSGLRTRTGSSLNVNYVIPIQSALDALAIRPTLGGKVPAKADRRP